MAALLIGGGYGIHYGYEGYTTTKAAVMNTHGLEMITTYEAFQDKLSQKETFLIYIGRQTCPFCRVLAPVLEKEKGSIKDEVPFCYFNVIDYKQAIIDKKEGAQERWEHIKDEIGFTYIPCILYYKEGKLEQGFYEFVGDSYMDTEDEDEKAEMVKEATVKLEEWFKQCGLYK